MGSPVLNHVVADVDGHIAWPVAGRVPDRPNWDGLLPVAGDGSHEWAGLRASADLPGVLDPPQGWVRSANQHNLDEDPTWYGAPTSYEWYPGYRARRLATVLAASDDWTLAGAAALQNDSLVEPAAELMQFFSEPFNTADAEWARREITAWDQRMSTSSRAAALFDRWLYTELPRLIRAEATRRFAPEGRADAAAALLLDARALTLADARVDIQLLHDSGSWSPTNSFVSTHDLVGAALTAAVAAVRAQCGPDTAAWSWDAVHVSRLTHPLHGVGGLSVDLTDTGSHLKAGSADCLAVAFGAKGVQALGAATRVVMDVGDWDASLCINSPGQDGELGSRHARDQYDTWLADGFVPMLYSQSLIAQHAESLHTLRAGHPSTDPTETSRP